MVNTCQEINSITTELRPSRRVKSAVPNLGNNRQSHSTTLAVRWCLLRLLTARMLQKYPTATNLYWQTTPSSVQSRQRGIEQTRTSRGSWKVTIEYWILRVIDRDKRKENRECDQACYWYWDSGRRPEMQKAMESLRLGRMRINRLGAIRKPVSRHLTT